MDHSSVFVICMGLGTVFFGLICLIVLTTLMGRVITRLTATAPVAEEELAVPAVKFSAGEPNRQELAAAVAAAVAEELGTEITGIRILSMRKI